MKIEYLQKSREITLHKHGGISTSSPQRNNKIWATKKIKLVKKINSLEINHGDGIKTPVNKQIPCSRSLFQETVKLCFH